MHKFSFSAAKIVHFFYINKFYAYFSICLITYYLLFLFFLSTFFKIGSNLSAYARKP